jgi:Zn-finger nucleic acid-binding protein
MEGETMPEEIKYKVAGIFSKVVNFACPNCRVPLSTALKDAGRGDACPRCGCEFISPGLKILVREAAAGREKQAAAERRSAEAAKQRSIQAATVEAAEKVYDHALSKPMQQIGTSKAIAVETVRKWHLTVCHDLCLPYVPVIVRGPHAGGLAGHAFYNWTQNESGFIAFDFDGLILGGPIGGEVSETYRVEIYTVPHYTEREYLHVLAHELRHIWQYKNRVPPTEEDCVVYAGRFLIRFNAPDCEVTPHWVDEEEWAKGEENARKKREKKRFAIAWAIFGVWEVLVGGLWLLYGLTPVDRYNSANWGWDKVTGERILILHPVGEVVIVWLIFFGLPLLLAILYAYKVSRRQSHHINNLHVTVKDLSFSDDATTKYPH